MQEKHETMHLNVYDMVPACLPLQNVDNGTIEFNGTSARVMCDSGYRPSGNDVSKCTNMRWDKVLSSCVPVGR